MVLFNYSTRELTAKIVFYGPGLCGKTTNLQYVYSSLPESVKKGKVLSLPARDDVNFPIQEQLIVELYSK